MNPPLDRRLTVELRERSYTVHIGSGLLSRIGELLSGRLRARRATILTDSNVAALYLARLVEALRGAGVQPAAITVAPGESSKSIETLSRVYDELARVRHARDEPILALGGGVVGDLAGFAAATWHRGVPLVQCPTSLEAMIDASVGGKTAINHPAGKNLIGAFHQPALVCMDPDVLATLSDRDFRAALAESVKHGVIDGPALVEWHEQNAEAIVRREPAVVAALIHENCRVKAAIVGRDERETASAGVGRAALNLGHTIGHALETYFEYELRHGEAVALGLIAAMDLAVRRAGLAAEVRDRVAALLARFGLPSRAPRAVDVDAVVWLLTSDKKNRSAQVRFVVPTGPGQIAWLELAATSPDIAEAIRAINPSA